MASLLSIIRKRTGETLTAGQEHWLVGLEKSDRRGFEAGEDPKATENDCPYTKCPYRDCWLEAFRRARGVEDAAKALNEFGVPTDVWSCMSEVERQRCWTKRWYLGRMKVDPLLFAKHKDRQVVHNIRIRERWAENPELFAPRCAKSTGRTWRAPELKEERSIGKILSVNGHVVEEGSKRKSRSARLSALRIRFTHLSTLLYRHSCHGTSVKTWFRPCALPCWRASCSSRTSRRRQGYISPLTIASSTTSRQLLLMSLSMGTMA